MSKNQHELDHEKNKIVEAALGMMAKTVAPEDEGELEVLRLRANEIAKEVQGINDAKYMDSLIGGGMDVTELARDTSKLYVERFHKWSKEDLLLLHVMLYTMSEVRRVSGNSQAHRKIITP